MTIQRYRVQDTQVCFTASNHGLDTEMIMPGFYLRNVQPCDLPNYIPFFSNIKNLAERLSSENLKISLNHTLEDISQWAKPKKGEGFGQILSIWVIRNCKTVEQSLQRRSSISGSSFIGYVAINVLNREPECVLFKSYADKKEILTQSVKNSYIPSVEKMLASPPVYHSLRTLHKEIQDEVVFAEVLEGSWRVQDFEAFDQQLNEIIKAEKELVDRKLLQNNDDVDTEEQSIEIVANNKRAHLEVVWEGEPFNCDTLESVNRTLQKIDNGLAKPPKIKRVKSCPVFKIRDDFFTSHKENSGGSHKDDSIACIEVY